MEWEAVRTVTEIGFSSIALVTSIVAFMRRGRDEQIQILSRARDVQVNELKSDVEKLDEKVDRLEARLSGVERDMRHLPDKDAVHRMEIAIAKLGGQMETMDERLKPVSAIANRMQDLLLEKAA